MRAMQTQRITTRVETSEPRFVHYPKPGARRAQRADGRARRRRLRPARLLRVAAIATPNIDRLAAEGLRYNRFHVTSVCSATRAALLTGRNHHAVGMGVTQEAALGFPGYTGRIPKSAATLARVLRDDGYNTLAVGKWHLAPKNEYSAAGPFDRWPLGSGLRALLRLPRRRDQPVGARAGPRQHPHRPAVHPGGGLPPHRGPGRPGDPDDPGPAAGRAAQAVLPLLRARRRARAAPGDRGVGRRRTAGQFDDGWEAWRAACLRPAGRRGHRPGRHGAARAAAVDPRLGDAAGRPAPALRPLHGGVRRLRHPHRPPPRPALRRPRGARHRRRHDRDGAVRQRRQRRGRHDAARSTRPPAGSAWREDVEESIARIDEIGGQDAYNHYPFGLGVGGQHAAAAVEAVRLARRRAHARSSCAGRPACDARRRAAAVLPRRRPLRDGARRGRGHAARRPSTG